MAEYNKSLPAFNNSIRVADLPQELWPIARKVIQAHKLEPGESTPPKGVLTEVAARDALNLASDTTPQAIDRRDYQALCTDLKGFDRFEACGTEKEAALFIKLAQELERREWRLFTILTSTIAAAKHGSSALSNRTDQASKGNTNVIEGYEHAHIQRLLERIITKEGLKDKLDARYQKYIDGKAEDKNDFLDNIDGIAKAHEGLTINPDAPVILAQGVEGIQHMNQEQQQIIMRDQALIDLAIAIKYYSTDKKLNPKLDKILMLVELVAPPR
jgi:hypothetical protein